MTAPLIGLPACYRIQNGFPVHTVGDKYVAAAADGAGGVPLLLPALGSAGLERLVDSLDGLLLTGSPSNVEPQHYRGEASRPGTLHDVERDATTLPLIRLAIERGLPLLAICRGHQELNVALGGTLHQNVHEVPGRREHRAQGTEQHQRYGPAHGARLEPGGLLARLTGATEIEINSLHAQAIDRLADALALEATAPDGTIEAVRVRNSRAFALGVQWHPEWRWAENPVSVAILRAFGEAARARAASRLAVSAA